MASSPLLYRPTPLERAQSIHLLLTYFNTPIDFNDDGEMRVSGRDAVPFLTSSGVDRGLLRLIWSVADPEGVGTLTARNQFHTILRLIAMAQAHFLPPGMEHNHSKLLIEALHNNSHLVMALPTFSRDVNPPSVAYLLSQYPTPAALNDTMSNNLLVVGQGANVDVSNMLVNHDVQFQMWQKQQQQQQQQMQMQQTSGSQWGGGETVVSSIKMSVDDAFGDMPEVEDRPLPSLEYVVQAEEEVVKEDQAVDDDFGDFDAAQTENVSEDVMADDEFDAFDEGGDVSFSTDLGVGVECPSNIMASAISDDEFNAVSTSVPNMESNATAIDMVDGDDDDFRGFESTTNQSPDAFASGNEHEFGRFEDNKPHSEANIEYNIESHSHTEAFGGKYYPQINNHGPTLSISDAFDSLVPDPEMSSVPMSQMTEPTESEQAASHENKVADGYDDFGDFEGTNDQSESFGDKPDENDFNIDSYSQTEAINDFSYPEADHHGPTLSISDAFESLVPNPEISSVPFNQTSEANELDPIESYGNNSADEDDDFGGFESTPAIGADDFNTESFSQAEAHSGDNFIKPNHHGPTLSISDAFESMVPNSDMSSVPITQISESNNEPKSVINHDNNAADEHDDFGGFESTPACAVESDSQPEALSGSQPNHIPTLSISDAFESMVPDPGMVSVSISQKGETNEMEPTATHDNNATDENDDFGDFEGTHNQLESAFIEPDTNDFSMENIPQTTIPDVFDAVVPDQDVPSLSEQNTYNNTYTGSFGSVSNIESTEISIVDEKKSCEDGNFNEESRPEMDKETSDSAFENTGVHVSATGNQFGLSAFDDVFGGVEDAPLPPLEVFSPAVEHEVKHTEESDFNESFGDFKGNVTVVESSPEAGKVSDITPTAGAEFGGFDSILQPPNPATNGFPQETEHQQSSHDVQYPKPESTGFDTSFGDSEGGHEIETISKSQTDDLQNVDHDDDFGGFSAFDPSTANNDAQTQNGSATPKIPSDFDESFGDFEEGNNACPEPSSKIVTPSDTPSAANDDFGGFNSTQLNPPGTMRADKDDDFGDFAAFEPTDTEADLSQHGHTDNFSGFDVVGSPSINNDEVHELELNTNSQSDYVQNNGSDDDFGGFAAFDSQAITNSMHMNINDEPEASTASKHVDDIHDEDNGDDFGGFAAFDSQATSNNIHIKDEPKTTENNRLEDNQIDGDDHEFGGFAAFDSNNDMHINVSQIDDPEATTNGQADEVHNKSNHGDDFEEFPALDSSKNDTQNGNAATPNDEPEISTDSQADGIQTDDHHDDFGGFAAFDSATQDDIAEPQYNHSEVTAGPDEDDFGDFAAFDDSNNHVPDAEFGDFDEFDSAPPNDASIESSQPYNDLREKICVLKQFHPPLPSKDTIISCFDECSSTRQSPQTQLSRCVLLCGILSREESGLSKQWENSISAIKCDLERGLKILDFFASKLSSSDRSIILQYDKLSNHILGLAEFVRIARYIMASLQDVLCLGITDTLVSSQLEYSKSKFITDFASIEKLWLDLSTKSLDLGVLLEAPAVDRVDQIRARYLNEFSQGDQLCELTLQPLRGCQGTSSVVTMEGKKFMACAANFLSNRLSQLATC